MMKKPELIILAISVGITIGISLLVGFAGAALIGSFWSWFSLALITQLILFAIANSYLLQKDRFVSDQLSLKALEQISKFSIKINCAYCQQQNVVPVQLNQKNTFKCDSCNQVNGITMQFISTPITTPIESVKIPLEGTESIEFKVKQ